MRGLSSRSRSPADSALWDQPPTGALGGNLATAHIMKHSAVIGAINASPLNRGLRGDDWVADFRNVAIVEGDDIVLFDYEDRDTYQIHVLLNSSRGRKAKACIRRAITEMFRERGAEVIFGMVPEFRRDVAMMARWVGMKSHGKRYTREGVCELFILRRDNHS